MFYFLRGNYVQVKGFALVFSVFSDRFFLLFINQTLSANSGPDCITRTESVLLHCRFSCVPVDFEVVNVNSSLTNEDDINNAIMAIRRNGVALKGWCSVIVYNRHF